MSKKVANWNITSAHIYGRIPQVTTARRLNINGTSHCLATALTPGWYEVYAVTSSNTGLRVFVADGSTSTTVAATMSYMIPEENSRIIEVIGGSNDYIAGITKGGYQGTLCIYKMD